MRAYYDEKCTFCMKSMLLLNKKLQIPAEIRFLKDFPETRASNLAIPKHGAMIVEDTNRIFIGYFGFKHLVIMGKAPTYLQILFRIPFASDFIGQKVYRLIASNRHSLGCDSTSCTLNLNPEN